MKSNSHLFLLSFLLLLLSCQKNDNPTSVSSKVKKISFIVTNSSGSVTGYTEYSYNSNGTISQVVNDGYLGYFKSVYTYSSSRIIASSFNNLNTEILHYEWLLAINGLVDSSFSYSMPPVTVNSSKNTYNSNSEVTLQKSYSYPYGSTPSTPSNIATYTYSNGNIVSQTNSTGFNYTYTYYAAVSNLTPEAFGLPYKLFQSINLLKSAQLLDLSSPGNVHIYNYTYTFDSNNRVVTKTEKDIYNGVQNQEGTYTYTYY